jgi:hypothetical protein
LAIFNRADDKTAVPEAIIPRLSITGSESSSPGADIVINEGPIGAGDWSTTVDKIGGAGASRRH